MQSLKLLQSFVCLVGLLSSGCAYHRVAYMPMIKAHLEPAATALCLDGRLGPVTNLTQQAHLPHVGAAEKYKLSLEALDYLTAQLGSRDYILIGSINGHGNAYSSMPRLRAAIAARAAQEGGDAVLLVSSGFTNQPYAVTLPGQATTTTKGSAYAYNGYAQGQSRSVTTYAPSQTYTGVNKLPHVDGLVFKYCPGIGEKREAAGRLESDKLQALMALAAELFADDRLSFAEAQRQYEVALESAGSPQADEVRHKADP